MPRNNKPKFAVCINADEDDMLTPFKIYRVLPDKRAEEDDYIRVIDDESEDYLYPQENFIFIGLPSNVEKALLRASQKILGKEK